MTDALFLEEVRAFASRMCDVDRRILCREACGGLRWCMLRTPERAYLDGIVRLSPAQLAVLEVGTADADRALKRSGCRAMAQDVPWKVHLNTAVAFPHTMHDAVMLPPAFFGWDDERRASVLVHEKVHLWQKRFPDRAQAFIRDVMGYSRAGTLTTAMRQALSVRANPDTDDGLYMRLGSRAVRLMVYGPDATELGHARLVTVGDGAASEYEHPYEEMAYEVTRVVLQSSVPAQVAARL